MIWTFSSRHGMLAVIVLCLLYWVRRSSRGDNTTSHAYDVDSLHSQHASLIDEDDLAFGVPHDFAPHTRSYPENFPKQIWQTSTPEDKIKWADKTTTWTNLNPDWHYNHLDDNATTEFVHKQFAHRPAIVHFWDSISDKILRADLFRYLALLAQGGVYSDIDTSNLVPIDEWVPSYQAASVNAVIGIEYDDEPLSWAVRPVSFCQWTLMAKPGHPIFQRVVRRAASNLEFLARLQQVELGEAKLQFAEVLAATGPGLITDVVMEVLRDQLGSLTWETFHNMSTPIVHGDVLILPINGFAGNQKHSNSGDPAYGPKFVQHHFGRSWYHRQKDGQKTRDGVD